MRTVHFQIDDALADAARGRAESQGKTLEAWLAELMAEQLDAADPGGWTRKVLESAETLGGNSAGWKWNREELYDREAARRDAQLEARSKSVDAWIADIMAKQPSTAQNQDWLEQFLAIALASGGDSHGQKWTRDELYDA